MGLNLALNLKEHHHKVQGLDISSTAVSQARENDIPAYQDRKSTRLNSSHLRESRMPSSA